MYRPIQSPFAVFVLLLLARPLSADAPWYVDDDRFADDFVAKLTELVKKDKCLKPTQLKKRLKRDTCKVELSKPGDRAMTPEEVYEQSLDSVLVLGSIRPADDDPDEWNEGRFATAWALTEDGILVTNWHVFDQLRGERYGVANRKGEVFPLVDILATNRDADLAIVKVDGKGFRPLPVAPDAKVGAWVGVLSHPGGELFTFTQGHVTRYVKTQWNGATERWMSITADFAYGSSGAPVLNRFGAVVGVATITSNIEYPPQEEAEEETEENGEEPKPGGEKKERRGREKGGKEKPPLVEGSPLQMVVKLTVPARTVVELCSGQE